MSRLKEDGQWSEEKPVWSQPKTDLRFATAAFDAKNKLWIAAASITPGKSQVVVRSAETP
jgi:hypothetical protein